MDKMKIFISHINEEAELAKYLKDFIEKKLLGMVEVYVSSNDEVYGKKWLEEIKKSINDAKLEIVLCSKNSINRNWINFEVGCAWIKDREIIPICHSGLKIDDLKAPLSTFHSLNLENINELKKLLGQIAKTLGLMEPSDIDYNKIERELKNIINKKTLSNSDLKNEEAVSDNIDKKLNISIDKKITDEIKKCCEKINEAELMIIIKNKYYDNMTNNEKKKLFYILWNNSFISDEINDPNLRRVSVFALKFLYADNKEEYKNLIKSNNSSYFDNLKLEFRQYDDKENIYNYIFEIEENRIYKLIKFVEENNDIFSVFNDYAKSVIDAAMNNFFTQKDITRFHIDEINFDYKLFEYKLIFKSEAVFLSNTTEEHFGMINRMIDNYCSTSKGYVYTYNYTVLEEEHLNCILKQVQYKNDTECFIKFLIQYCMGACSYDSAISMFKIMIEYKELFTQNDYYRILMNMDNNSQVYDNNEISNMMKSIQIEYRKKFDSELIDCNEEKILYKNLYKYEFEKLPNYNINIILDKLEERALNYTLLSLWRIIKNMQLENKKIKKDISSYRNIIKVLSNKNDEYYNKEYIEFFKQYLNKEDLYVC